MAYGNHSHGRTVGADQGPATKPGLVWAPGRSVGAVGGRDVARGTCRASALRLGAVKAALHLLGPTIGLKMAYAGCRNLSD